ncbi:MAG: ATP-dependent sacrificial sulfur transferase LarE [Muribaculaceae bacterium]|nr:ATP-dependent sacrificial sulfur transferase LarE [Roseburia sp.]MCM1430416.1 ATP-dependent sacrificial sulfur transferase LarE [Muribaculaceae bacterium]MCM1492388.1 ATP-dependent sacrificial sulfur transferase LarE [Muribaculaceae bacterium]
MHGLQEKYGRLQKILKEQGQMAIAFSGGVDSAFLLCAAVETLGRKSVLALTAVSPFFPERELAEAKEFCVKQEVEQLLVPVDTLQVSGVAENPQNRCYICKRALFQALAGQAKAHGIRAVAEGSNTDDEGDYRPGLLAVEELGVKSPLREAGLSKEEIRALSRELGLSTWDKPGFACLASRFAYGERITEEKLRRVEKAEQYLLSKGFRQLRVRLQGDVARIEVLPEDFSRFLEEGFRLEIYESLQSFGFSYIALDLKGFRSGSMNETLDGGRK